MMQVAKNAEDRFAQLRSHMDTNFTHANTVMSDMCTKLAETFSTIHT